MQRSRRCRLTAWSSSAAKRGQRTLCQEIARGLDLAAQVGDPMVRMGRVSTIGPESGIDRRLPQPDWAVSIGLSMGPVTVPTTVEAAK